MWIRSQNKELLANVKNARVIYEFDSYHIVCDCDDCDCDDCDCDDRHCDDCDCK